jgi:hypothetical protein
MKLQTMKTSGMVAVVLFLISAAALLMGAQRRDQPPQPGEFFIISSVNAGKKQLVLKEPTEVTELVAVTDKTECLDEQGEAVPFKDFRAGDTVYVTFGTSANGERAVLRIRKGAMTVGELHRRYLTTP